jgi:rod shape-determining protein MreD
MRTTLLYILTLILTLLPLALIRFGVRMDVLPDIPLIILYFYASARPVLLLQVFIYGIFVSECYGSPLGLESLLFVIFYYICSKYRAALLSKKPLSLFVGFVLLVIIYSCAKYFMMSLYYHHWFDFSKVAVGSLVTILFYPIVDMVLKGCFPRT